MRLALLAALLVLVAMPASAGAAPYIAPDPPPPGYGLSLAEKRWPSKCTGATRIIELADPEPFIGGRATGMRSTWDGRQWVWRTEVCEFSLDPGLDPVARCEAEIHEYLHLAFEQAAHVGVLDGTVLGPLSDYLCGAPKVPRTDDDMIVYLITGALPAPRTSWIVTCKPLKFKRARHHRTGRTSCRAASRIIPGARRYRGVIEADGQAWVQRIPTSRSASASPR